MTSHKWCIKNIKLNTIELNKERYEQLIAELWNLLLNNSSLPQTDLFSAKLFEIPIMERVALTKKVIKHDK